MSNIGRRPKLATPLVTARAGGDAHRVDAVAQPASRVELEIGGRKAELAAALVAVDHFAGHEPRIAEQLRRLVEPPGGERVADRAGRHRAAVVLEPRHHVDGEAVLLALGFEEIRRAGAVHAEVEVEADHGAADGKALDQDAADEVLRREAGQRRVEREHDRAVEPGRGQKPQFDGLIGQPEQRLAGIEEGARMRLEGQRRRRPAQPPGQVLHRADHGAVAAMHAVEIADGDYRATQGVTGRAVAHDEEIFRRHRPSMVKKVSPDLGAVPATLESSRAAGGIYGALFP